MKFKEFALRFLTTYAIGFVAAIIATLFTNYFIRKNGLVVDWDTCFMLAFILALVIPYTQNIKDKHG